MFPNENMTPVVPIVPIWEQLRYLHISSHKQFTSLFTSLAILLVTKRQHYILFIFNLQLKNVNKLPDIYDEKQQKQILVKTDNFILSHTNRKWIQIATGLVQNYRYVCWLASSM